MLCLFLQLALLQLSLAIPFESCTEHTLEAYVTGYDAFRGSLATLQPGQCDPAFRNAFLAPPASVANSNEGSAESGDYNMPWNAQPRGGIWQQLGKDVLTPIETWNPLLTGEGKFYPIGSSSYQAVVRDVLEQMNATGPCLPTNSTLQTHTISELVALSQLKDQYSTNTTAFFPDFTDAVKSIIKNPTDTSAYDAFILLYGTHVVQSVLWGTIGGNNHIFGDIESAGRPTLLASANYSRGNVTANCEFEAGSAENLPKASSSCYAASYGLLNWSWYLGGNLYPLWLRSFTGDMTNRMLDAQERYRASAIAKEHLAPDPSLNCQVPQQLSKSEGPF